MVTIQDIAEKLNVSKGTVSKALNGAADVSETLRKSILETAVEMGYSRTLHKRDAKTLCIFIENMSCQEPNDFGYDIVVGFRKAAEPSGYLVEVVPLDDKTQKHTRYDEYMLKHNYAGALFLDCPFRTYGCTTCRLPTPLPYCWTTTSKPTPTLVIWVLTTPRAWTWRWPTCAAWGTPASAISAAGWVLM